jgi:hypothetical protein
MKYAEATIAAFNRTFGRRKYARLGNAIGKCWDKANPREGKIPNNHLMAAVATSETKKETTAANGTCHHRLHILAATSALTNGTSPIRIWNI